MESAEPVLLFKPRALTGPMALRSIRPWLALLALALLPGSAPAWDEGGHEIIATIAGGRLNAKARAAVEALASQVPNNGRPYDAVTMACWMDDIRSRSESMPDAGMFLSWHYVDIGLEDDDPKPPFEPGDDNPMHGNALQALKRAMVVLRGGTDPYITSSAMAAAIAMHLVGDIHQPLHAATKYFYSHGREMDDRGGNREGVDNGPPNEPRFNLHAFWDSAWRATMGPDGRVMLDERFKPGRVHHPEDVAQLAAEMARDDAPSADTDLEPRFDSWAWESNNVARSFVYRDLTPTESLKYCRLSSSYIREANHIARQRLVLAAYRLATLLNETLGADHPGPAPASYPAGPASADVPGEY
jgi:hypothetical protein